MARRGLTDCGSMSSPSRCASRSPRVPAANQGLAVFEGCVPAWYFANTADNSASQGRRPVGFFTISGASTATSDDRPVCCPSHSTISSSVRRSVTSSSTPVESSAARPVRLRSAQARSTPTNFSKTTASP